MARYVVLSFEDNERAMKYAEQIKKGMPEDYSGDFASWAADVAVISARAEVVAVAPKPTKFCDCASKGRVKRGSQDGFSRGKKYGWWFHTGCGKPSKGWGKSYKAVLSSANNILGEREEDKLPGGLHHND